MGEALVRAIKKPPLFGAALRLPELGRQGFLVVDVLVDYVAFFVEDFVSHARPFVKCGRNFPIAYIVNSAVLSVCRAR